MKITFNKLLTYFFRNITIISGDSTEFFLIHSKMCLQVINTKYNVNINVNLNAENIIAQASKFINFIIFNGNREQVSHLETSTEEFP